MQTTMDMTTGKLIESEEVEFGRFRDQVLKAEWIPAYPELRLQSFDPQRTQPARKAPCFDVEAFLHTMYCNQR